MDPDSVYVANKGTKISHHCPFSALKCYYSRLKLFHAINTLLLTYMQMSGCIIGDLYIQQVSVTRRAIEETVIQTSEIEVKSMIKKCINKYFFVFQSIEDFILLIGTSVAFVAFVLWCCFPIEPKDSLGSEHLSTQVSNSSTACHVVLLPH